MWLRMYLFSASGVRYFMTKERLSCWQTYAVRCVLVCFCPVGQFSRVVGASSTRRTREVGFSVFVCRNTVSWWMVEDGEGSTHCHAVNPSSVPSDILEIDSFRGGAGGDAPVRGWVGLVHCVRVEAVLKVSRNPVPNKQLGS